MAGQADVVQRDIRDLYAAIATATDRCLVPYVLLQSIHMTAFFGCIVAGLGWPAL
jgi:hypothetical protein